MLEGWSSSAVEYLPQMGKVLGSIPSATITKKEERERDRCRLFDYLNRITHILFSSRHSFYLFLILIRCLFICVLAVSYV